MYLHILPPGRSTRSNLLLQASPIGGGGESLDSKSSPVSPPHSNAMNMPGGMGMGSPTSSVSTEKNRSYNLNSSGSGGGGLGGTHSSSFGSAPSISLFSHGHCNWPGCDTSIIDDASGPFSDASIKAFERYVNSFEEV